jgi:DICT domain-containing protein
MPVTLQQLLAEVLLIEFTTTPQNLQNYLQTYGIKTDADLYFNRVIATLPQEFKDNLFQELANKKLVIQSQEIEVMEKQLAAKRQMNSEIVRQTKVLNIIDEVR